MRQQIGCDAIVCERYLAARDDSWLAMKRLEELKKSASTCQETAESAADEAGDGMRQ